MTPDSDGRPHVKEKVTWYGVAQQLAAGRDAQKPGFFKKPGFFRGILLSWDS